jgi:hypothetical protein
MFQGTTMKKIFFELLILFLSSLNLSAQDTDLKKLYTDFTTAINSALLTKQGSIELSGLLTYNYMKTEYENAAEGQQGISHSTQNITQIEPQLSYFVIDDISLGLVLDYSHYKTEYELSGIIPGIYSTSGKVSYEQTFIGPVAKMYFGEEKLRPFIFADYLVMFGDSHGGEMDLGAGIFYHISGNFGINFFGKYGMIWPDENSIESQQRIFIGLGITNFIL